MNASNDLLHRLQVQVNLTIELRNNIDHNMPTDVAFENNYKDGQLDRTAFEAERDALILQIEKDIDKITDDLVCLGVAIEECKKQICINKALLLIGENSKDAL